MIKTPHSESDSDISRWQTPNLDGSGNGQSQQTYEEIREAAYEAGFKEGHMAGLELSKEETAEKLDTLTNLINAMNIPFADINQQVLDSIVTISGKIAKSLVRRELRTEPEAIMAIVRDSVVALNTFSQRIQIYLHPEDASVIRKIIHSQDQSKNNDQQWDIVEDPLISRGNCKIRSNDSIIDADIQARIDLIITQVLGDERSENRK